LPNTSLIVDPEPAFAPVILPVLVPKVHAKVLGALAVKLIFGLAPLHTLAVAELITAGVGFTVTVILVDGPAHEPPVEVGVTI
jgi:hypothetical protein